MAEKEIKNLPVFKVRCRGVSGTVWKNEKEKDGKKFDVFSVNITKSYKDKDDNWKNTDSYGAEDLHAVEVVARRCYENIKMVEDKGGD